MVQRIIGRDRPQKDYLSGVSNEYNKQFEILSEGLKQQAQSRQSLTQSSMEMNQAQANIRTYEEQTKQGGGFFGAVAELGQAAMEGYKTYSEIKQQQKARLGEQEYFQALQEVEMLNRDATKIPDDGMVEQRVGILDSILNKYTNLSKEKRAELYKSGYSNIRQQNQTLINNRRKIEKATRDAIFADQQNKMRLSNNDWVNNFEMGLRTDPEEALILINSGVTQAAQKYGWTPQQQRDALINWVEQLMPILDKGQETKLGRSIAVQNLNGLIDLKNRLTAEGLHLTDRDRYDFLIDQYALDKGMNLALARERGNPHINEDSWIQHDKRTEELGAIQNREVSASIEKLDFTADYEFGLSFILLQSPSQFDRIRREMRRPDGSDHPDIIGAMEYAEHIKFYTKNRYRLEHKKASLEKEGNRIQTAVTNWQYELAKDDLDRGQVTSIYDRISKLEAKALGEILDDPATMKTLQDAGLIDEGTGQWTGNVITDSLGREVTAANLANYSVDDLRQFMLQKLDNYNEALRIIETEKALIDKELNASLDVIKPMMLKYGLNSDFNPYDQEQTKHILEYGNSVINQVTELINKAKQAPPDLPSEYNDIPADFNLAVQQNKFVTVTSRKTGTKMPLPFRIEDLAKVQYDGKVILGDGAGQHGENYNDRGGRHDGLDVPARTGTPIVSLVNGKVLKVVHNKDSGGYGHYITILDSATGKVHRFAHLHQYPDLKKDDQVRLGQTIGLIGSTGRSTGPHLHWEILDADTYGGKGVNNPEDFMPSLLQSIGASTQPKLRHQKTRMDNREYYDTTLQGSGGDGDKKPLPQVPQGAVMLENGGFLWKGDVYDKNRVKQKPFTSLRPIQPSYVPNSKKSYKDMSNVDEPRNFGYTFLRDNPSKARAIEQLAKQINIPAVWIADNIATESGFSKDAKNDVSRAVGLIQFVPIPGTNGEVYAWKDIRLTGKKTRRWTMAEIKKMTWEEQLTTVVADYLLAPDIQQLGIETIEDFTAAIFGGSPLLRLWKSNPERALNSDDSQGTTFREHLNKIGRDAGRQYRNVSNHSSKFAPTHTTYVAGCAMCEDLRASGFFQAHVETPIV